MRKLLIKILPRELKAGIGKYLVLFLFMTLSIGFISGFLVTGNSIIKTLDKNTKKYNIEDGNIEVIQQASDELIEKVKELDIELYDNFYIEDDASNDSTLRIYKKRTEVNKECIMDGKLPENTGEIAIDRLYAKNNKIKIDDTIKVGEQSLKVTGFVSLPDYICLFQSNSDIMFETKKFGVGVVTEAQFEELNQAKLHYCYSWKYKNEISVEQEKRDKITDLKEEFSKENIITNCIPEMDNKGIHFAPDDISGDKFSMVTMLGLIILVLAFIYAVITSSTIESQATVIGTLRASGYKKSELVWYYLSVPLFITIAAAILGNVLGYTGFKFMVLQMYTSNYSLPTYTTYWHANAFLITTVIPIVIMIAINVIILVRKLSLSPLKFMRNDLKSKNYKPIKLPDFKFTTRFKVRVILQNVSGYLILIIGILFANILLLFGSGMSPIFEHYKESIQNKKISNYQYLLKAPVPSENEDAEEFCVGELRLNDDEDIQVFGISENSKYVSDLVLSEDEVVVSKGYADKYDISKGDTITLTNKYSGDTYDLKVSNTYDYPAALSVFMSKEYFNEVFDKDKEYFNGYFSNDEIKDIDEQYISATITEEDLTKLCRQMDSSMGEMFRMVSMFATVLYMLVVYLLSKIIIEKNASGISTIKILGYKNSEIFKAYMIPTLFVAIFGIVVSIPLSITPVKMIFNMMITKLSGYIPFYMDSSMYMKVVIIGIVAYLVLMLLQYRKLKKVPMNIVLNEE